MVPESPIFQSLNTKRSNDNFKQNKLVFNFLTRESNLDFLMILKIKFCKKKKTSWNSDTNWKREQWTMVPLKLFEVGSRKRNWYVWKCKTDKFTKILLQLKSQKWKYFNLLSSFFFISCMIAVRWTLIPCSFYLKRILNLTALSHSVASFTSDEELGVQPWSEIQNRKHQVAARWSKNK